jgi:hypothetical protein
MWQDTKMSDYWYLVAVIGSLTLGVQIVAGPYSMQASSACP